MNENGKTENLLNLLNFNMHTQPVFILKKKTLGKKVT